MIIEMKKEQNDLTKVFLRITLPFPLESTEMNVAKSSPYTVRFGNQVIRMQLSVINRCYSYICYLSLHSEENENVTVMKKFQLNFGFLHLNDYVIFPPSIGDGIDTDDDRLHDISTPGSICIAKMLRIPINSRYAFEITKKIICQIKFHKEFDESEKILDAATLEAYETLLNDEILTDCIILCEDGMMKVKAHKLMLAAHSSIFYSMLQNSNEINMKNVQHNIVSEMMRFLYCRKINGSEFVLLEMLKVADEYEINDLKKFTEQRLMRGVTIETAVERVILAHVHKATILKNFILEFICNRWNMIKENEVNVAMLDEYPVILREIINKFAVCDYKRNNNKS